MRRSGAINSRSPRSCSDGYRRTRLPAADDSIVTRSHSSWLSAANRRAGWPHAYEAKKTPGPSETSWCRAAARPVLQVRGNMSVPPTISSKFLVKTYSYSSRRIPVILDCSIVSYATGPQAFPSPRRSICSTTLRNRYRTQLAILFVLKPVRSRPAGEITAGGIRRYWLAYKTFSSTHAGKNARNAHQPFGA
jgi:hypothetical protein